MREVNVFKPVCMGVCMSVDMSRSLYIFCTLGQPLYTCTEAPIRSAISQPLAFRPKSEAPSPVAPPLATALSNILAQATRQTIGSVSHMVTALVFFRRYVGS